MRMVDMLNIVILYEYPCAIFFFHFRNICSKNKCLDVVILLLSRKEKKKKRWGILGFWLVCVIWVRFIDATTAQLNIFWETEQGCHFDMGHFDSLAPFILHYASEKNFFFLNFLIFNPIKNIIF